MEQLSNAYRDVKQIGWIFTWPEHQAIVAASAAKVPNVITFSGVRKGLPDAEGLENCVTGLNKVKSFAEEHGGSAGGPVETMIVMEEVGRALALEPYLATVVLAGGLLRLGGGKARCADLMPKIAGGDPDSVSCVTPFCHDGKTGRTG